LVLIDYCMKVLITILITFIQITDSFCQKLERQYFDKWDTAVKEESAFYFEEWPLNTKDYERKGYYLPDNQVKSIEIYKSGLLNGLATYYHPNGQLHHKTQYVRGSRVDTVNYYYPNGQLHTINYYDTLDIKDRTKQLSYRVLLYTDSVGKIMVKAGNGFVTDYEKMGLGYKKEIGRIKGGLRDSVWVGYYPDGKLYFTETWVNGVLQAGKSTDPAGDEYLYTTLGTIAEPKGGMQSFYRYVGQTMRYPTDARRAGIEGRVFLEFVVGKDGTISDARVIRGIGGGCDEEAIRTIMRSPNWIPGKQRGRPVRTKFNLALIFKLS
jgi:TonB family protein